MATAERSDHELLRAAQTEPAAFGEFYDRHAEAVTAYAYRRTDCAATAADLAAEVFAAAYAKRHTFRDTGAPARAWLFGIARRQLGSFARRRRVADRYRRRFGIADHAPSQDELRRIETLVDLEPVAVALRAAVATLPQSQQQALWLRVVEGRPYVEVAASLGCSEGAARVRVSRGLARLADLLEAS